MNTILYIDWSFQSKKSNNCINPQDRETGFRPVNLIFQKGRPISDSHREKAPLIFAKTSTNHSSANFIMDAQSE